MVAESDMQEARSVLVSSSVRLMLDCNPHPRCRMRSDCICSVKPSGSHVGLINLLTSGCRENLHAIIAGTEQDRAENIDGKM